MSAMQLPDLDSARLGRALRRSRITSLGLGLVALVVGVLVGYPLGGFGVVLGLVAGVINTRSIDGAVARLRDLGTEPKAARRPIAVRTVLRLVLTTCVVVALLFVAAPVGLGMLLGLVLYQGAFLSSMVGAVLRSGVSQ